MFMRAYDEFRENPIALNAFALILLSKLVCVYSAMLMQIGLMSAMAFLLFWGALYSI